MGSRWGLQMGGQSSIKIGKLTRGVCRGGHFMFVTISSFGNGEVEAVFPRFILVTIFTIGSSDDGHTNLAPDLPP